MSAGHSTSVARVVYSRSGAGAKGASKQLAPHFTTPHYRLKAPSEEPAMVGSYKIDLRPALALAVEAEDSKVQLACKCSADWEKTVEAEPSDANNTKNNSRFFDMTDKANLQSLIAANAPIVYA